MRFAYRRFYRMVEMDEDELNTLGADGWELVTMDESHSGVVYIFKKRVTAKRWFVAAYGGK